jgi:hypothetical protein
MNDALTASYVFTADELIAARANHWRTQCRPAFRAVLIVLALLAILAGWGFYRIRGWSAPTVLAPLVGIYFLFLRKFEVRWAVRRHFRKRPDRNTQVVWTFGEDALQIRTGNSEARQNWNQISKVRKARHGFLLYPNDTIFYWIPATAFGSDADRTRAEALLRDKVADFADIR